MDGLIDFLKILVFSYLRYFVAAGLAFVVLYKIIAKHVAHLKIQNTFANKKDFLREISNSMIVAAIFAVVAYVIVYTDIRQFTNLYTDPNTYPLWWMPLSLIFALIIHDTYFYWMHRTLHHHKIYKTVHLEHHKSTNPSPWASYSFHIIEGFIEILIVPILLFTLPMHISMGFVFSLMVLFINVYGHLGYEIMPKSFRKTWLFEIIGTSTYHNLHHEKFNYNFGLYFRVWDRLMGTEYPKYVETFDKLMAREKSNLDTTLSINNTTK